MAAATTVLAATSLGLGAAKSIADISAGSKRMKEGKRAVSEAMASRQTLTNAYEGMSVPTSPYEMQRQEIQRNSATAVDALSKGGVRGVVGGVGAITSSTQQSMAQLGSMFEQALFNLNTMKANDEARIQQMKEQRTMDDLGYARSEVAYGRQQMQAGFDTGIDTAASGAEYGLAGGFDGIPKIGGSGMPNNRWEQTSTPVNESPNIA